MNRREQNIARSRNEPISDEVETEIDELDLNDRDVPSRAGDKAPQADIERQRSRDAGLTGAAKPGEDRTKDDATPDTLVNEDGARSPNETGSGGPMDERLSKRDASEIGGGEGLDEAELGRVKPLDGKPWNLKNE